MRKYLFKINGSEARYYSKYDECTPLNSNEVIVNFIHDNFLEVIHIDDSDIKCLQILKENGMRPIITR